MKVFWYGLALSLVSIVLVVQVLVGQNLKGDQNAALRYLSAIARLPPITDSLNRAMDDCLVPEIPEKILPEIRDYLKQGSVIAAMRLLKFGASCTFCDFCPDNNGNSDEDMSPPFRKIRELVKIANLFAWQKFHEGNHKEAFEVFLNVFSLGQNLEQGQGLIGANISRDLREIAVRSVKTFFEKDPQSDQRGLGKAFFSKIPRPAMNVKNPLEVEKKSFANIIRASKDPSKLANMFCDPPPEEFKEIVELAKTPEFEKKIQEGVSLYDEGINLNPDSPDFEKKLQELITKIQKSPNPLVRACLASPERTYKQQQKLQKMIDYLLAH
ncbi:MAG: hypothetical protein HQM08_24020 [Candidatus Riflebacteria bacterium]|nr:hypothetical protein [Candidatus Riflebacteria bacterium]